MFWNWMPIFTQFWNCYVWVSEVALRVFFSQMALWSCRKWDSADLGTQTSQFSNWAKILRQFGVQYSYVGLHYNYSTVPVPVLEPNFCPLPALGDFLLIGGHCAQMGNPVLELIAIHIKSRPEFQNQVPISGTGQWLLYHVEPIVVLSCLGTGAPMGWQYASLFRHGATRYVPTAASLDTEDKNTVIFNVMTYPDDLKAYLRKY